MVSLHSVCFYFFIQAKPPRLDVCVITRHIPGLYFLGTAEGVAECITVPLQY